MQLNKHQIAKALKPVVPKLQCTSESLRVFGFAGLGGGRRVRICFSNRFLNDPDAAIHAGTTL